MHYGRSKRREILGQLHRVAGILRQRHWDNLITQIEICSYEKPNSAVRKNWKRRILDYPRMVRDVCAWLWGLTVPLVKRNIWLIHGMLLKNGPEGEGKDHL